MDLLMLSTISFGGGPSSPPPAPTLTDPAVEAAKKKELELSRRRRGRSSTILTGPSGVDETSGKKTTLGG